MPEYRSPINGAILPRGRPFEQGEKQREIARKAGKRSQEVQRLKRGCREIAKFILDSPAPVDESQKNELAKMLGIDANEISINMISTFAQAQKAAKGDLAALVYLRDTAGEKPSDKVEVKQKDYSELDSVMKKLKENEP